MRARVKEAAVVQACLVAELHHTTDLLGSLKQITNQRCTSMCYYSHENIPILTHRVLETKFIVQAGRSAVQ